MSTVCVMTIVINSVMHILLGLYGQHCLVYFPFIVRFNNNGSSNEHLNTQKMNQEEKKQDGMWLISRSAVCVCVCVCGRENFLFICFVYRLDY
jgi:hypothetical protein